MPYIAEDDDNARTPPPPAPGVNPNLASVQAPGYVGGAISSGLRALGRAIPVPQDVGMAPQETLTPAPQANAVPAASTAMPRDAAWTPTALPTMQPITAAAQRSMAPTPGPLARQTSFSNANIPAGAGPDTSTGSPADLAAKATIAGYGAQLKGDDLAFQQSLVDQRDRAVAAGHEADRVAALRDATGEARVANWRATNGADMVLRGGTFHGQPSAQQQAILHNQAITAARVQSLQNPLPLPSGAGPIDAYAKAQEAVGIPQRQAIAQQVAVQQGALGQQQLAVGKQHLEKGAIDLQAQQHISGLQAKLSAATDPKVIRQLQNEILVLHGKDPQHYTVHTVNHPDTETANGLIKKGGQSLVLQGPEGIQVINHNGDPITGGGGGQEGGNFPKPIPTTVSALKDGKVSRADFEKYYGPGSAAQYLK